MALHHVELWVPDLAPAIGSWGWLLGELGYELYQDWAYGRSWRDGEEYIVVEQSPAMMPGPHDRCRAGLNHLAFWVPGRDRVDALAAAAPEHGWTLLFPDRHPWAGGPEHYAAYLENADAFEAELVAAPSPIRRQSVPGTELMTLLRDLPAMSVETFRAEQERYADTEASFDAYDRGREPWRDASGSSSVRT